MKPNARKQPRKSSHSGKTSPYPGFERDLTAHQQRSVEIGQANAEPLPGPLFDAFAAENELAAAGIRPVVAYDFVILRKINSPLYRQTLEMSKPEDQRTATEWDDDEGYEMLFQFTRPIHEVRAALNRGREAFREAALQATADQIHPTEAKRLIELVTFNFLKTFSTALNHAPGESGNKTVFTAPPAVTMTASAGGLNMSRG